MCTMHATAHQGTIRECSVPRQSLCDKKRQELHSCRDIAIRVREGRGRRVQHAANNHSDLGMDNTRVKNLEDRGQTRIVAGWSSGSSQ